MNKTHINLTIDSDLIMYLRNNPSINISGMFNDFIATLINKRDIKTEEESRVLKDIEDLKEKQFQVQKQIQELIIQKHIIDQKKKEEYDKETERLRQNEREGEALINSGFINRVLDGV